MKTVRIWAVAVAALTVLTPAAALAAWEEQFSIFGSGNNVLAVAAGTGLNAVAFGVEQQMGSSSPMVLYTKDGGVNWVKTGAPGQFALFMSMSMPDEDYVYAGGLGFFQSKNGGQSFIEVKLPGGGGMFEFTSVESVHALDPVHVFAVGGTKVYWTPNSLQWEYTEPVVDVSLSSVFFLDSMNGWIAGGKLEEIIEEDPYTGEETVVGHNCLPKGTVMFTTDGGKSFAPLVIGAEEYFKHITFINKNIGFAVASSNDNALYIKRTVDGGKSWSDIGLPEAPDKMIWMHLSKLVMTSPMEGWAAGCVGYEGSDFDNMGNDAVILHSSDGGMSWDYDPEGEGMGGYMDIAFGGPHWGWAVGSGGRIMAYTDGTEWAPPDKPEPDEDVVGQPDEELAGREDVASWNSVFGVFGDEVLIGQSSFPGGAGGGLTIGPDEPECEEVTQSTGCSLGAEEPAGQASALLMLALLAGLLLLARACTRPRLPALGLITLVVLVSCGGEETVMICPDTGQAVPREDVGAADVAPEPAEFSCGLTEAEEPAVFGGLEARMADKNDLIAFVKKGPDGGSDLYLYSPKHKKTARLTRFNDPAVHVWNPSWSPDREFIAFSSNFRADFNEKSQDIFVISLDGAGCFQVTPGILDATIREPAQLTATVTGSFKYGQGSVTTPVSGATAGFSGGTETATTGSAGEFALKVAPGTGLVVVRGLANGMKVKAVAKFDVKAGETKELGQLIAFVEAEYRLGQLFWSSGGDTLYAFVSEQLESLVAVDMNTGESAPFLSQEEDTMLLFAPLPDADMAVVAYNSDPTKYFLYTLGETPEISYEFVFEGQTAESLVAVSPMRFLATVREERLVLLGSEPSGALKTVDVTPANLSGLVPGQLDWSLGGAALTATISGGDKSNIVIIDVNSGSNKGITTDGLSSMPAWFGR